MRLVLVARAVLETNVLHHKVAENKVEPVGFVDNDAFMYAVEAEQVVWGNVVVAVEAYPSWLTGIALPTPMLVYGVGRTRLVRLGLSDGMES